VVEEIYYAVKGDSLQIRREADDGNIFSKWEGLRGV
jgi:hypothetical protein